MKAITQAFFGNHSASLGRGINTSVLFEPFRGELVVFATVAIHHALKEYTSGILRTIKFDGITLEGTYSKPYNR